MAKIIFPPGWKDVTEEHLGKTIVIIGYPRPAKKPVAPALDETEYAIDETEEQEDDE